MSTTTLGAKSEGKDQTSRKKPMKPREGFGVTQLLATISDPIILFDVNTCEIVDVNQTACALYGYSFDEFIRLKVSDVSAEPEKSAAGIKKLAAGEKVHVPLRYNKKKDGTIFPVEISTGIFMQDNRLLGCGIFKDLTAKIASERALKESEARYRGLFENMIDGVAVYESRDNGRDFVFVDFNAAAEKITDISREAVLGKSVLKVFPGVREMGLFEVFRHVWRSGEGKRHSAELYRDDRFARWVENSVYKLPSGEIVAVFSNETERMQAQIDLKKSLDELEKKVAERTFELASANEQMNTEIELRKQAEKTLKESEKKFKRLFANAPLSYQSLDDNGRLIEVNQTWLDTLGYTRQEVIGKSFADFLHPDWTGHFKANFSRFKCAGQIEDVEFKLRRKDGSSILAAFNGRIGYTPEGEFRQTHCIFRDITLQRNAEDALRESERRFRLLAENINDVFWISKPGINEMVYVSPAYEKIWGRSRDSLYANPPSFVEAVHPEDRERLLDGIKKHARRKWNFEYRLKKPDGSVRWIKDRGFPVRNDQGDLVMMCGVASDITDLKLAEDKIRASLREKEILLREIHHRVKNNMQTIISMLRLQIDSTRDDTHAKMLKESQDRIVSMSLVHEKLYQSEDLSSVNFHEYVGSLANGLFASYNTDSSKIKLVMDIEDISFGVDNAIPCGLIVNELVANSLKHAFPADQAGTIHVAMHDVDDGEYELIVKDDGIGIPQHLDIGNAGSMGLHLVSVIAGHQLGGSLAIERDAGTRCTIRFKKTRNKCNS